MNMYNQNSAEVLSLPIYQYDLMTSEPQLCWRGGEGGGDIPHTLRLPRC